ncbi:hypothetical protein J3A83DRAFT_4443674 [Scleroderma citrinum]
MGNILRKNTTQPIGEQDIVVFLVGPAGSGKSTVMQLMHALAMDRQTNPDTYSLDPSTRDVQARRYTFDHIPQNVVLVDTPSFHTGLFDIDAESAMRKWIQLNFSANCHRSGILYLHDLARNPREKGLLMQHHLDTFAKTFPAGYTVPSCVCVVPTIDRGLKPDSSLVQRHGPKLEAAVRSLGVAWNASMFPERFRDEPELARKALRHLLRNISGT